jgi:hypothetical protein
MSTDRPNEPRPSWSRSHSLRRHSARRARAARPWYADRLDRNTRRDAPLGPYETRYDVSDGYSFDRTRLEE